MKKISRFANFNGAIAQLVEQWTENPCVPGSNPGSTTNNKPTQLSGFIIYCCFSNSTIL